MKRLLLCATAAGGARNLAPLIKAIFPFATKDAAEKIIELALNLKGAANK